MWVDAHPLCDAAHSTLAVVDTQARLAAAMAEHDRARVVSTIGRLIEAAGRLGIPVQVTEQYPQGLGATVPELLTRLPAATRRHPKTGFSCCTAQGFMDDLEHTARKQVVLTGMEAHVCVLQTALDLHVRGHQVFVVEDAVCSRRADHCANGLRRLRDAGLVITNSESVLFEWIRDSRHPDFKAISALVKPGAGGT
ncbi:MAG: hydrolase [Chromatiales bacterium 21-64-14]|nr:MAG: hydrolase [Chromatiales bacterium 21-64-14]HQU15281.1 isochorismatase family protein [Gammaproteobacteria bacterium]